MDGKSGNTVHFITTPRLRCFPCAALTPSTVIFSSQTLSYDLKRRRVVMSVMVFRLLYLSLCESLLEYFGYLIMMHLISKLLEFRYTSWLQSDELQMMLDLPFLSTAALSLIAMHDVYLKRIKSWACYERGIYGAQTMANKKEVHDALIRRPLRPPTVLGIV